MESDFDHFDAKNYRTFHMKRISMQQALLRIEALEEEGERLGDLGKETKYLESEYDQLEEAVNQQLRNMQISVMKAHRFKKGKEAQSHKYWVITKIEKPPTPAELERLNDTYKNAKRIKQVREVNQFIEIVQTDDFVRLSALGMVTQSIIDQISSLLETQNIIIHLLYKCAARFNQQSIHNAFEGGLFKAAQACSDLYDSSRTANNLIIQKLSKHYVESKEECFNCISAMAGSHEGIYVVSDIDATSKRTVLDIQQKQTKRQIKTVNSIVSAYKNFQTETDDIKKLEQEVLSNFQESEQVFLKWQIVEDKIKEKESKKQEIITYLKERLKALQETKNFTFFRDILNLSKGCDLEKYKGLIEVVKIAKMLLEGWNKKKMTNSSGLSGFKV